jgi:hypothetical protein
LTQLLADVDEGNVASEQILGKFGFECVGWEDIPGSGRVIRHYELSKPK